MKAKEAAKRAGIGTRQLTKLCANGTIFCTKSGDSRTCQWEINEDSFRTWLTMRDMWLTIKEAAKASHYSKRNILRAIHAGDLPAVNIGRLWRINPLALEAWAKEKLT